MPKKAVHIHHIAMSAANSLSVQKYGYKMIGGTIEDRYTFYYCVCDVHEGMLSGASHCWVVCECKVRFITLILCTTGHVVLSGHFVVCTVHHCEVECCVRCGGVLCGVVECCVRCGGVLCVCVVFYHRRHCNCAWLCFADGLNTVLVTHCVHTYTVPVVNMSAAKGSGMTRWWSRQWRHWWWWLLMMIGVAWQLWWL